MRYDIKILSIFVHKYSVLEYLFRLITGGNTCLGRNKILDWVCNFHLQEASPGTTVSSKARTCNRSSFCFRAGLSRELYVLGDGYLFIIYK